MQYVIPAEKPDTGMMRAALEQMFPDADYVQLYYLEQKSKQVPEPVPKGHHFAGPDWDAVNKEVAQWQNGAGCNAYVAGSVNDVPPKHNPRTGYFKKLGKAETQWTYALVVDVDPPKIDDTRVHMTPEQRDEWVGDLIKRVRAAPLPQPTWIVFTGGGIQLVYLLTERVASTIKVDLALERLHRDWKAQLGNDVGIDGTFARNVLSRLVGSVNYPDKDKADSGQIPAKAWIVDDTGERFDFDSFPTSPSVPRSKVDMTVDIALPEGHPLDPTTLSWVTPYDIRNLHMRDVKTNDKSKSGVVRSLTMKWAHRGATPSEVLSLLWNPAHEVSKHFEGSLEKAVRQVGKCWPDVVTPEQAATEYEKLKAEVEAEWVVVRQGSLIAFERNGDRVPTKLADLRTWLAPKKITGSDGRQRKFADMWFEDPQRDWFSGYTLDPDYKTPPPGEKRLWNLWCGWNVNDEHKRAAEAMTPVQRKARYQRFINHIWYVLADGDEQSYEYIMNFLIWAVQNPALPSCQFLIFSGGKEYGKGILGDMIAEPHGIDGGGLFGHHGAVFQGAAGFTHNFNAELLDLTFVVLDEFQIKTEENQKQLDMMITGKSLWIERKGVDRIRVENRLKGIMLTNKTDDIIKATEDVRRFMVFACSDYGKKQGDAYFKALAKEWYHLGGKEAFLVDALDETLPVDWTPASARFETIALQANKDYGMDSCERAVFEMLQTGDAGCYTKYGPYDGMLLPRKLFMEAHQYVKNNRRLKAVLDIIRVPGIPDSQETGYDHAGRETRARFTTLPDLATARKMWLEAYPRIVSPWEEGADEWAISSV